MANLQCYVENTTLTHVTWFKGSKELHPSYNYSFVTYVFEIENHSIVRFLLTVHSVSERDFGEYRCRIGSLYNSSEDVASVWILSPAPPLEPPVGMLVVFSAFFTVMFDMNFLPTQLRGRRLWCWLDNWWSLCCCGCIHIIGWNCHSSWYLGPCEEGSEETA